MPVPSEPFAAVYEDRNRLGVIVARTGRGGFEAYAAGDHCLGLFPSPREAAAAITTTRRWVAEPTVTSLAFAGGGIDDGKADDKAQRTGPRDFVLRRDRH
jgi:hypothetical protein